MFIQVKYYMIDIITSFTSKYHNIVDANMSCKSKIVSFKTPQKVCKRGFQKKLYVCSYVIVNELMIFCLA
jgi:hypothetical protein